MMSWIAAWCLILGVFGFAGGLDLERSQPLALLGGCGDVINLLPDNKPQSRVQCTVSL
jgi:hypothetical protein